MILMNKTEKINFKLINYMLLISIIFLAFYIRFINLDQHFSHTDDLIAPKACTMSVDKLFEYANKRNIYISDAEKSILRTSYPYIKPLIVAFSVSKGSTYAPVQFLFTGFIVNQDMSYRDILFYSRLISFLLGFLSILIILYIFFKIYRQDSLSYTLFSVTILSFSWEHIIYSMQSESYAIGLFVALMSFSLYITYITKKNISTKDSFLLGIFMSIFIFSNYQFLFFLPGFYLSIFLSYQKEYKRFFSSYLVSIIVVSLSTLVLYKVFLSSLISKGINWNAGPNQEFLFNINIQDNIVHSIQYIVSFFVQNTYYVFRNLISFTNEGNIINDIATGLYMILFIVGIFSFYYSKNIVKKYFVYYFLFTIIIWIILILMQKLTLSPTRHSLILLSFILVFTPAGLIYLLKKYGINKDYIITIITISILFSFSVSYKSTMNKRLDKFSSLKIEKLIKKYNITEIYAYNYTRNLNFMRYVKNNFYKKDGFDGNMYFFDKTLIKNNIILFITHRKMAFNEKIKKNFLEISERPLDRFSKIIYKEENKSDTEICFGNQTKNGTNSLFLYVVKIE